MEPVAVLEKVRAAFAVPSLPMVLLLDIVAALRIPVQASSLQVVVVAVQIEVELKMVPRETHRVSRNGREG